MAKKLANPDKAKCWDDFSKMIRVVRCLATTGLPFTGICITCGRKYHISYLQAGHCFAGRSNVKLLNRKFVDIQCSYCNEFENGKPKKFRKILEDRYGVEYVERQYYRFKRITISDKDIDWAGRRARYKRMVSNKMQEHGYKTYKEMLEMTRT